MTIKDEYLEIRGNRELVGPEEIVDWAEKHPASEFYRRLEWDNEKAGHAYRLWQVRTLLAIHVKDDGKVREIISLSIDRKTGGYRLLDEVIARPQLRAILLSDAMADLRRVRAKHGHLVELAKVWKEIDAAAGEASEETAA